MTRLGHTEDKGKLGAGAWKHASCLAHNKMLESMRLHQSVQTPRFQRDQRFQAQPIKVLGFGLVEP